MKRARHKLIFGAIAWGLGLLLPMMPVAAGVITPLPPNAQVTDAGLTKLADATLPDMALLGNTLYATWLDERNGYNHPDVYFAQSTDGGQTWGANTQVSERPYDDWPDDPTIAVQPNGTIWVAWYLFYTANSEVVNDVRLARSIDGGQSWQRFTVVNGVADNEDLWRPALAVDASHVYVLYHLRGQVGSEEGFAIKLKVIDPQTPTNATTTDVSDAPVAGRMTDGLLDNGPAMTLQQRNGLLCAAWEDRRSTFAIYGACSSNQGATFGPNFALSGANAVYPVLALAPDGTLYGSYTASGDARRNIRLRASADQGVTWREPLTATYVSAPFVVGDWDLAVDANGQLLLSWIHEGLQVHDVLFSTSVDGGQNFSTSGMEDGQGQFPAVSEPIRVKIGASGEGASTRAHLLWEDDRNVHSEIWATTALLDGVPPSAPPNLQAQADDNSILLTWQPATDASGIRGYRVYRATAAEGPFGEITHVRTLVTFYRDVELLGGTTYFYRVAAVDNTGNTGPTAPTVSAAAQAGSGLPVNGTIAYESGDSVKLRNLADGAESTIANAAAPHFAPDGQQLYINSNRTILARPPGGGQFTTLAGPFASAIEFDVAGDHTAFAVTLLRQFGAPGVPGGLCTVTEPHYFERAGQEKYVNANTLASDLALSADRQWLAYRYSGFCNVAAYGSVSPPDLCLVQTTTGTETCSKGLAAQAPDFAPNDNWLVFAAPITGQAEIWKALVQADGTLTQFTQLTRGPVNQPARDPSFSTDGNWVVFARDVDSSAGSNVQLFVVRSDGQGIRPLNVAGEAPAWLGGGSAPPQPGLTVKVSLPVILRR